jgi:anti-anti-sigma factor
MCWWIEQPKRGVTARGPVLAAQLDLHERRISLRGRVDHNNVAVLTDVTATLIAFNPGDSTVDISGVSVLDAAGIACIAEFGSELASMGADLKVVGAAARPRRKFGISGFGRLREAA